MTFSLIFVCTHLCAICGLYVIFHTHLSIRHSDKSERIFMISFINWCNDGNITNGKHGHGGIERTLRLLKDTLPPSEQWAGMRQSVQASLGGFVN